jgi:exopolysaccharide production protein ExoZ
MDRLRALQILRFAAALAVVQCHASFFVHRDRTAGFAGVDVFFVISGYIVSRSAGAHPEGFLLKRALRVLPLYYLVSAPCLFFGVLHGAPWQQILATLTLWPVYDKLTDPLLVVAWSLSYEMLFYLALALVLKGVRPAWLLAAYAVCALLRPLTGAPLFQFLGSPLICEFLAGVAIALGPSMRSPRLGVAAIALALAALALGAPIAIPHIDSPLRVGLFGPPAALLVWGALQVEPLLSERLSRPFVFLGDASYALYLTHCVVMVDATQAGLTSQFGLIALSVAVGGVVHLRIERPLLAWSRRLHGRARDAATPSWIADEFEQRPRDERA